MRADAGYVTVAAPESTLPVFEQRLLEAVKRPLPDEAGLVARNVHDLRPPRLVRTIGLEAGPEAGDLQEVEARAIRARHGADRPAIALEPADPGLPQRLPRRTGRDVELDRRPPRRASTRRHALPLAEGPGEGELPAALRRLRTGAVGKHSTPEGRDQRDDRSERDPAVHPPLVRKMRARVKNIERLLADRRHVRVAARGGPRGAGCAGSRRLPGSRRADR